MEIYLIRHGQTDYNLNGIVQGSGVDSNLNDMGIEQSIMFFEQYKNIKFDSIFISELTRTRQSVAKFIEAGIPFQIAPELNEICWGIYEGKKLSPDEKAQFWNVIKAWNQKDYTAKVFNGESALELQKRQLPFVDTLKHTKNCNNILVCLHGRALRSLLCTLLNKPLCEMESFEHSNFCLYKLKFDGDKFEITSTQINSQPNYY